MSAPAGNWRVALSNFCAWRSAIVTTEFSKTRIWREIFLFLPVFLPHPFFSPLYWKTYIFKGCLDSFGPQGLKDLAMDSLFLPKCPLSNMKGFPLAARSAAPHLVFNLMGFFSLQIKKLYMISHVTSGSPQPLVSPKSDFHSPWWFPPMCNFCVALHDLQCPPPLGYEH